MTSRFANHGHPRASTVSVLDIGSSKITCLIAQLRPCEDMDVLHGRTHRIEVAVGVGGGEPKEAQDSQVVFANPLMSIADETHAAVFDIL